MHPSRRTFLATTALSASSILGLPELQDREPAPRPKRPDSRRTAPRALEQAQAAMRARKAPGLLIAIPAAAAERASLLLALADLVEPRHTAGSVLFARAVVACVAADALPLGAGENVVLVDADGARLAGAKIAFQAGNDAASTIEALHALIDVRENARWAGRKAGEPAAGEGEIELLLRGGPAEQVAAAKARLAALCGPGSYALWRWRVTADPREKDLCAEAILQAWHAVAAAPAPLPFGVGEAPHPKRIVEDPCPWCGMAVLSRRSLHALEFLTETEKPR